MGKGPRRDRTKCPDATERMERPYDTTTQQAQSRAEVTLRGAIPARASSSGGGAGGCSSQAFEPATTSVDEAIFDLELMDYDFQLFQESVSDVDSVVYQERPAWLPPHPGW